jgi:hypothetical protein
MAWSHNNAAEMERAVKPERYFDRNIAQSKSEFRTEHDGIAHRGIGQGFVSTPTHAAKANKAEN